MMEFPAVRWRMPTYGTVKVNIYCYFVEEGLPNGNRSSHLVQGL